MSMTEEHQVSRIDAPLERRRVGDMKIDKFAGLEIREFREAVEFCKLVAQAQHGVPPYLRGNPGDCLVVCSSALRWRLEPVWCMQHSYVAKAESIISYDSAVISAIILASGLLKERPRYFYSGEGDDRICMVTATFKGESSALEYTTPPLHKCRKHSPLWQSDPDQQLGYFAIRNWGRRHCPEVLGGVYDRDEFADVTQEPVDQPMSPNLMSRLPGKMAGTGFTPDVVDNGLAKAAEAVQEAKDEARKAHRTTEKLAEAEIHHEATAVQDPMPPTANAPKTAQGYMDYAARWIEKGAKDPEDLMARWDGEREMRDALNVPVGARKRLEAMLTTKAVDLRDPKKHK